MLPFVISGLVSTRQCYDDDDVFGRPWHVQHFWVVVGKAKKRNKYIRGRFALVSVVLLPAAEGYLLVACWPPVSAEYRPCVLFCASYLRRRISQGASLYNPVRHIFSCCSAYFLADPRCFFLAVHVEEAIKDNSHPSNELV